MIFIDTGSFIARYMSKDKFHKPALATWELIEKSQDKIFTSNFVLDETITLLGRWADSSFAAARARSIFNSASITILRPGKYDELEALKLFEKYADQSVSYTDCVSFVMMRANKIERVFSFDRHFEVAGFTILPSKLT